MTAPRVVEDDSITWINDCWTDDQSRRADLTFGVLQIPFDFAVSSRPGTRYGPRAVCEALRGYSTYSADKRVSFDRSAVVDFGEVSVVHSLPESYRRIRDQVAALPPDVHPVLIGGDHSITDPIIRGLLEREPDPFGLIVFDAHFDSRVPNPGHEHSGHWMHTIRDVFSHEHTVQIGINAPIYSQQYMQDAEKRGVLVLTPYDLRRIGWQRGLEMALQHATRGGYGVYVSIDIDALDQSVAPGTAVPNPVGLSPSDVADAVFEISRDAHVVGLDIAEVSPPLDSSGGTAQVAAHLIHNHWAGVAYRAASRPPPTMADGLAGPAHGLPPGTTGPRP